MVNNRLTNKSIPSGNVTLRFDGQTLESLRKEAEQKRISLNTLASQIFKTHIEFSGAAATVKVVSAKINASDFHPMSFRLSKQ